MKSNSSAVLAFLLFAAPAFAADWLVRSGRYRGGMQDWKSFGLTTAPWRKK